MVPVILYQFPIGRRHTCKGDSQGEKDKGEERTGEKKGKRGNEERNGSPDVLVVAGAPAENIREGKKHSQVKGQRHPPC